MGVRVRLAQGDPRLEHVEGQPGAEVRLDAKR